MPQVKIKTLGTDTALLIDNRSLESTNLKSGDVAEMFISNHSIIIFPTSQKSQLKRQINNTIYRKEIFNPEHMFRISVNTDRVSHIKALRGKYKDRLSSSTEFAQKKKDEILIEG
jgi:antitoxin component of MazEF toxin-antitoxin module